MFGLHNLNGTKTHVHKFLLYLSINIFTFSYYKEPNLNIVAQFYNPNQVYATFYKSLNLFLPFHRHNMTK